jgi:multisubunit Na+/H+ antiporter MnhF subunit
MAKKKKELKGISGLLIVVLIAFGISIISCVTNIISFILLFSLSNGNYLPLLFSVVYAILTFLFIYSIISMIKKKKKSKKIAIFSLWLGFLIYMILVIISSLSNSASISLYYYLAIFNGVCSLALTKYFLDSKRVKNTFTK